MSNTDTAPAEVACAASTFTGVLHPREVPLGGPRAIRVRRTLPQRERSLIGAWCFVDHYGPRPRGRHGRAAAPAHRPADRQLAVRGRDRAPRLRRGARAGASGRTEPDDGRRRHLPLGGVHRRHERSARGSAVGGAARLRSRHGAATSPTMRPTCLGVRRRPFGCSSASFTGSRSPVHTFTPLLGAQVDLDPGARVALDGRAVLRARRAGGPGPHRGGRHRGSMSPTSRFGRRARPPHAAQPGRQPGPGRAARRSAV